LLGEVAGERDLVFGLLGLQVLVEQGDDVAVDVVCPQARIRSELRVAGQEWLSLIQIFEVLHQDCAFVRAPVAVAQRGHEAAGVDVEEEFGLAVDVDFDILVGEAFVFEGDPDAVHEGAEAGAVEFEVVVGGVGLDGLPGEAGGLFVVGLFRGVAALVWVQLGFGGGVIGGHSD